jgi:integrase/recombinase XerD
MNKAQQKKFDSLYQRHLNALTRQGKSDSTIDVYSRALRRVTEFFDRCPDRLTVEDLKDFFASLVKSHSWSTVRSDRCGLQFFYKHVLGKQWDWVDIVKPPQVKSLPDILTPSEIELVINSTREARYQMYILTVYSMGLRLGEGLNLKIGDIDKNRMKIHIRNGKGRKDRFVTLPEQTLKALRLYWKTHRNPSLIFPAGSTSEERHAAKKYMNKAGLQASFKTIIKSCNIHKKITVHNLRHCYGTHLVEQGLNLRAIQHEMGHECPKTTALYTQLTEPMQQQVAQIINSLVDRLSLTLIEED